MRVLVLATIFLCGCAAPGGFLGTGIGAPAPAPEQPYGFQWVHLMILGAGALMAVGGVVLVFVFKDAKMGGGLFVAGICTLALGWAAGYYGRQVALASAIVLGVGAVGMLAQLIWMRYKELSKHDAFKEVVQKANGQLDQMDLTDKARAVVERVKKSIKPKVAH